MNLAGACEANGTDKYYPTTTRNYLRVAPSDDYQGAFVAEYAKDQGVTKAYILNDKESYGEGVAGTTKRAMESVGIEIVGDEAWNPKASSYEALMNKIKGTGADAIFLGGLISENGGQVIKDKVAVLGPNDGAVKLFAPDGFENDATITESGGAAAGGFFSNAGAPVDKITGKASAEFQAQLKAGALKGKPLRRTRCTKGRRPRSCSTRSPRRTARGRASSRSSSRPRSSDGIVGSFHFNENGDPEDASGAVVAFTMYKAADTMESIDSFSPDPASGDGGAGRIATPHATVAGTLPPATVVF